MNISKAIQLGHFILIILLVVSIGVFGINQVLTYFYHSELLQKPCDLCYKLNPQLDPNFITKNYNNSFDNYSEGYKEKHIIDVNFSG